MHQRVWLSLLLGFILGIATGIFAGLALAEKASFLSADADLLVARQAFGEGNYAAAVESALAATDGRPHSYSGYEIEADVFC